MIYIAFVTLTTGTSFGVQIEANDPYSVADSIRREGVIRSNGRGVEYYATSLIETIRVEEKK